MDPRCPVWAGVTYGVDEEAIDSLCADWPAATEAGKLWWRRVQTL
ncbi:MAG: hypothetical protein VCF24_09700 [Candidatus Latescibacterota bacterium]